MNLIDVANMTSSELKEKRAEAIEAAKSVPVDELAGRAVQWLCDAKMRDEKLSEQGKTITLLQAGLEKALGDVSKLDDRLAQLSNDMAREEATNKEAMAALVRKYDDRTNADAAHIGKLEAALAKLQLQAKNYRQLAISGRAAINKSAGILNEVIAQFQLADAYNGE